MKFQHQANLTKSKKSFKKSIKEEVKERPSILEMIFNIYNSYYKNIKIKNLFEIYITNFTEYYKFDKTVENEDDPNLLMAQFYLGKIYSRNKLIPRDLILH